MKKYYFLLMAMLMAVMTFGLTACGNEDNDEPDGGDIVGTWSGKTSEEWLDLFDFMYAGGEQLIQFKKDGTFIIGKKNSLKKGKQILKLKL